MVLASGHRYDVFVSYAHDDNQIPEGTTAQYGWVTALARNLNVGPNVYKKSLFIDHQLKPGDEFDAGLMEKVRSSALLVLLLSQNYIDSEWCGKELDEFIRSHANDPDKPVDVFVVELFPYETFTDVPSNVQNLRKRLIHAKFWHQPADAASPLLAGYPTPPESGPQGRDHYWNTLNELRVAIDSRLRAHRTSGASAAAGTAPIAHDEATLHRPAASPFATVLLADVTDDLEAQRSQVKVELEAEKIVVLPDGDYVGLTPDEFDAAIDADLKRSSLFVQLLSPTTGRKIRGFAAPLPQLQYQRAAAAELPILQWCEQPLRPEQIGDNGHGRLFDTPFLRATHLTAFKSEVLAQLRALIAQPKAADTTAAKLGPLPRAGRKLIFLDDIASDAALNAKLRVLIRGANCDIRSLPPNAPLGNNGIDIREALRSCRAGITIFGDRSKVATVYNRLVYFLNQIAEADLPLSRWGVYMEGGTVASELRIESDDVVSLDESAVAGFLSGL